MSVFEEMHPRYSFEPLRDYDKLKRMLSRAIERGFVEEVPVMITRPVPSRAERGYRDKETGETIFTYSSRSQVSRCLGKN
jgi:hypothetical protein